LAADEIDLADDAPADEIAGTFANRTDELVARHAFETHVAFEDLQVGGTDAGEMNFNNGPRKRRATASRPYSLR
jgi:hypothetical protein